MTEPTKTDQTEDKQSSNITRRIKSFVLRQGRLSAAQQKAIDSQWPKFGLAVSDELLDLTELFGRDAPTIVEIGFGMGKSLAEMAEANPQQNYIGIEVHRPGIGALLKLVEEKGLTNVRVYNHDAIEVLEKCIPKDALAGVYLFFPDPWHKKRHNKRRIVQPGFVNTIASYLKPGGQFHMATDWQHYAEQMLLQMDAAEGFSNTSGARHFSADKADRCETKFERRGLKLGHGVWDLIYKKQ